MWIKVAAGETLGLERSSAAVCVPVGGGGSELARERMVRTVESVVAHTDAATPLVIAGSAALIEQLQRESPAERTIHALVLAGDVAETRTTSVAETRAAGAAASAVFPGDLVLVRVGVRVTADWLERLRAAALSDSIVASATPLSLGAGGVGGLEGVEEDRAEDRIEGRAEDRAVGQARLIAEAARELGSHSLRLRPRIAAIGPGCAYVRRETLELVGPLEESLALEDALAELAVGALAAGMVHVAADDVLVEGSHDLLTSAVPREPRRSSGALEAIRETIESDERGRLSRALGVTRTALRGLSVTIDGRALTPVLGGTQTYILELVAALARDGGVAVRVLVPDDLSERARRAFAGLPDVGLLSYEQALGGTSLSDVVHRPQQAFTPDDMTLLRLVGRRVVIGQQDLIAYHNHSYHPNPDRWRAYRRTTRLALAAADQIVFFSEHARRDALAEDLMPVARAHVVSVGAEALEPADADEQRPGGVPDERPFVLCVGADYAHKNRCFAIELAGALEALGWPGCLVLAGAHVDCGSSRERERELLAARPELAERVIDLGPVDEPCKRWLYRHTRALLYPTLYEGFGLLPLEAARAGLPCLFAAQASLAETAGDAATLIPWDPRASAAAVAPLLVDGSARERHLAQLCALPIPSWSEVAQRLIAVYEQAVAQPSSEAAPRAWQELDRESFIVRLDRDNSGLKATAQEYQDAYHSLSTRVAIGLPLIDRGGLLSPAQQRGLMRLAGRRWAGGMLLAPLEALGRRESERALDPQDGTRR